MLLQAQLSSQGVDGDDVQLDPAQIAEYRKMKADADVKTSRLLQEKATIEAQLKVGSRPHKWIVSRAGMCHFNHAGLVSSCDLH